MNKLQTAISVIVDNIIILLTLYITITHTIRKSAVRGTAGTPHPPELIFTQSKSDNLRQSYTKHDFNIPTC